MFQDGFKMLSFEKGGKSYLADLTGNETFDAASAIEFMANSNTGSITPAATTTGGATGGELNNAGAEFVGAGNPTGGGSVNVVNEGAKVNTVSSNQTHMNEDTGTKDKSFNLDLD